MTKLTNLSNITRVRFNDYTEYNPDKCNNGGCYGFWTDYNRLPNGKWEISYDTTADMDFCPCCGVFGDHYEEGNYTCGNFEAVSESELIDLINNFTETEDEYIEYK